MKFLKISCFFLVLIFCFQNAVASSKCKKRKKSEPAFNYVTELRKVDSLLNQVNQPKTAQDVLNNIKQKASKEKQNGYYIRCIQFQQILNNSGLEADDTFDLNWKLINEEILKGSDDIKAFLSIDAAGYLKGIYEQYRWQDERIPNDNSVNPNNWSLEKLNVAINVHIDNALIFSEGIADNAIYEPLIEHFKDYDFKLSIQQVLMRSAIGLLNDLDIPYDADYKMPKGEDALAPFPVFSSLKFSNSVDPRNEYKRIGLYQRFLNSINSGNTSEKINALIYFDLERINALRSAYNNNESAYLNAVEYLYNGNLSNPYSNLAAWHLADFYKNAEPVKAIALINEAIARHPGFKNEKELLYMKANIEIPGISVQNEDINQPGRKLLLNVVYSNISKIYVTAYKINKIDYLTEISYRNEVSKTAFQYLKTQSPFSKTYSIDLPSYKDYISHSAEVALDSLSAGTYILMVSNLENVGDSTATSAYGLLSVAPYTIVRNENVLYLLNANNGMPCANEPFKVYFDNSYRYNNKSKQSYEELYTGMTNSMGVLDLSAVRATGESRNIIIETGNKLLYYNHYIQHVYNGNNNDNAEVVTFKTITDRSIYRPGQTVHFKIIAYDYKKKRTISGKKTEVILKDYNGEEKGKLTLVTNAYGSVSGTFVLPKGGFNTGDFNILINGNYSASFRVEEYKRPKYAAKFLAPEKAYKLNDEVTVKGEAKAFAGYAVHDAKVEYRVTRKVKNRWGWDKRGWTVHPPLSALNNLTIISGQTTTDKDGIFLISFKALSGDNVDSKTNPYFIFEIAANITDLNGEIKSCSYSMTMAFTDLQVSISGNDDNALGQPVILNYSCTNLQDQPLPFSGTITIEKVLESKQVMRKRFWETEDTTTISEKDFNAWFPTIEYKNQEPSKQLLLTRTFSNHFKKGLVLLPSELKEAGTYIATIKTKDSRGETLTAFYQFKLTPNTAGPYQLADALKIQCLNGSSFEPKNKARILVSSGAKNARVLLSVKSNRGIVLEREIRLSQSSQIIEIPVEEADRGNIHAIAYMVNDYRLYAANKVINVPYSNKELSIKLSSFRDESTPGANEKWIVRLNGPAAEKAAMESVAVMYDQSLDAIYENASWPLRIFENYYHYDNTHAGFGSSYMNELAVNYFYLDGYYEFKVPYYAEFMSFNYSSMGIVSRSWGFGGGAGAMSGVVAGDMLQNEEVGNSTRHAYTVGKNIGYKDSDGDGVKDKRDDELASKEPSAVPVIRKNFNETAFFYPHLIANKNGEISLEFTMPEALTQWKMRMLAHSTTMQTGYLEHSITTSKKVMVQPNVPRFLRQGDHITIASKIINTTAQPIVAKANFTLMDEAIGLPLKWLMDNNDKSVNIPANSSSPVSFSIKIPDYTGLVTLSITAVAGTFSDGEQHTLSVLSNRTMITESMPITVRKAGTQNLEFNSLKNNKSTTLTHEKLSVEMSSNPAWYAIQALPYMMEFPHECAEQTFTRLYANSIASTLANGNPEIKKVFAAWERQAATGNGLQSKLLQNQDLKSTLIEETPWLYEAKNETERMRKLGVLFNQEKMKEELQTNYEKLKQMQSENGAFGWFKGMQGNSYITQTIVIGFGKMKEMGIDISTYSEIIEKAISFLDGEARRDYKFYKAQKEFKNFYPHNLQYLYCKSYFPQVGLSVQDSIVQYFIANTEKKWVDLSMLNKAQLAITLRVLKPASLVPDLIIRSFNENAKQSDEMGMYWPMNKNGFYWYDASVETHTAIIEAYLATGHSESLNEQLIWLLRQKQTQSWGTTRSTADACFALLFKWRFVNQPQQVSVSVNNVLVIPEKTEEGTGYYRQNLPKESISANSGNIQISASTADFAYGAVYWQYFEQMDKIHNTGSGLHIEKKIFKVVNTSTGVQKIEVLNEELKTGDIIEVSLNISCDRNLEFVHVKDLRGSGTEPVDALSEYRWQNGLGYYQSTKDVATHFFIDNLPKGIYQLNYKLKVEQAGVYNAGTATIQCMYAPEYIANSSGKILKVK